METKVTSSGLIETFFCDVFVPLQNVIRYGSPCIFTSVALETTSWCNRNCKYCPTSTKKRDKKILELSVIHNVLDQLGNMRFNGTIYIHLFNEPLFDKRLPSIVSYARERCPDSRIFISSNGDYLNHSLMTQLIDSGLDILFVTQYDGKINTNIEKVQKSLTESEKQHLSVRVQSIFQSNRGGALEFLKINGPLSEPCFRPQRMLVINSDGKVAICCNDYFGQEIMGDVRTEKILEIWHNKKFRYFREQLRSKNRSISPVCKTCNEIINLKECTMKDLSKTTAFKILKKLKLTK